nr:hypothetical protein [uncultured Blautia sp.]
MEVICQGIVGESLMDTALQIVEKAEELGYDKCGIIPVSQMSGYADKLEQRIHRFPETEKKFAAAAVEKTVPQEKKINIFYEEAAEWKFKHISKRIVKKSLRLSCIVKMTVHALLYP